MTLNILTMPLAGQHSAIAPALNSGLEATGQASSSYKPLWNHNEGIKTPKVEMLKIDKLTAVLNVDDPDKKTVLGEMWNLAKADKTWSPNPLMPPNVEIPYHVETSKLTSAI